MVYWIKKVNKGCDLRADHNNNSNRHNNFYRPMEVYDIIIDFTSKERAFNRDAPLIYEKCDV